MIWGLKSLVLNSLSLSLSLCFSSTLDHSLITRIETIKLAIFQVKKVEKKKQHISPLIVFVLMFVYHLSHMRHCGILRYM